MKTINVILSGGVGSRLWPLSRKARPKQYLPIINGKTLFQLTASRNRKICDHILVVGNEGNRNLSKKDLASAGLKDFQEIVEACPRNTAAAIAFAAFSSNSEDILFVTPSDHLIKNEESYGLAVGRGIQLAKKGYVVTFGLKPTYPETGFGYIEADGEDVISFREKPDQKTASYFVSNGNFLWNSGIFCFQAGVFLEELLLWAPEVYHSALEAYNHMQDGELSFKLSLQIPAISVDYAVMEQSKKVKVVPSAFDWSDMGSFESIYEYLEAQGHPKDGQGNMVIGTAIHTEFTGLTNALLIHTEDAILVLQKEKAQEVKKVYERLERERPDLV